MGLLDWFRRKRDDEPDIIPLPALRPLDPTVFCNSVTVDETGFVAVLANDRQLRIEFEDLDRVAIRTTDDQFVESVFWLLSVGEQELLVPHGAPDEDALFERLMHLPGFDKQAMVEAVTSTEDGEVECWRRGRE